MGAPVVLSAALSSPAFMTTALAQGLNAQTMNTAHEDAKSIRNYEQWFDSMRTLPNGKLDSEGYQAALAAAKQVPAAKLTTRPHTSVPGQSSTDWTAIGPSTITDGQTFAGDGQNVFGRVTSIAIAPNSTLYVGGADGGVWSTTYQGSSADSTANWSPLTDREPSLAIGSIAAIRRIKTSFMQVPAKRISQWTRTLDTAS